MEVHIVCDEEYKYAPTCKKQMEELGYTVVQHAIPERIVPDGLLFGQTIENITYTPKSQWKPYLINMLLNDGDVFYVDADTYMHERVDELFEVDVVITTHEPSISNEGGFDHITSRLNAGVLFVKSNECGRDFVKQWMGAMQRTHSGSDQEALMLVMDLPYITKVPCRIYNNTRPEQSRGKIDHYPGSRKKYYPL